jgi:PIN domain nuclease of toxin-antitoxin system
MLLDTCALLWLVEGGRKISRPVLRQIEASPSLCISAISAFELARKVHDGKLKLSDPVTVWINDALEHHGISTLPVDLEVCVKAAGLPPIHADPCDRFIIATALLNELPVVTSDSRFVEYGIETIL